MICEGQSSQPTLTGQRVGKVWVTLVVVEMKQRGPRGVRDEVSFAAVSGSRPREPQELQRGGGMIRRPMRATAACQREPSRRTRPRCSSQRAAAAEAQQLAQHCTLSWQRRPAPPATAQAQRRGGTSGCRHRHSEAKARVRSAGGNQKKGGQSKGPGRRCKNKNKTKQNKTKQKIVTCTLGMICRGRSCFLPWHGRKVELHTSPAV